MKCAILLIALANLYVVNANDRSSTTIDNDGTSIRRRNVAEETHKICASLGLTAFTSNPVYQTKNSASTPFMGIFYRLAGGSFNGDCKNPSVCQEACKSFASYKVHPSNSTCTCSNNSAETETFRAGAQPTQEVSPNNLVILPSPMSPPTKVPTSAPLAESPTEKTVFCANPFGNPCGPMSACTDTPTGITCTPINAESCPLGCGPNASCKKSSTGFECMCNSGFERPESYLPCM